MRKEILFAVVMGGLLGLFIAFGAWKANSVLGPKEKPQEIVEEIEKPEVDLAIVSPKQNQVVTTSPAIIEGITQSKAIVVVISEEEDTVGEADDTGEFSLETDLAAGLNKLYVFGLTGEGKQIQKELGVVYSSAFKKYFTATKPKDKEPDSTAEADPIRAKVEEKINEVKSEGTAYVGAVTDISENTIQIKDVEGQIQLVSVDEETDYINQTGKSKVIDLEDVAIGDFVTALGFINGNGVLKGKRVLVTVEPDLDARKAILGTVTEKGKEMIKVDSNGTVWTVNFPKTWKGPDLDEIKEGSVVIVAGETQDNEMDVRTIKLLGA